MTANPDALSHVTFAPITAPLIRVAPWSGRLILMALVSAGASAFMAASGHQLVGLMLAATTATLLVLSGVARVAARGVQWRRTTGAQVLAKGLADDPVPVLVTDRHGAAVAANRAGADTPDIVERLADWCADPRRTMRDMLADCLDRGVARREYSLQTKGLQVSAHVTHIADGLVVWRFVPLESGRVPAIDSLGLPVVTVGEGTVRVNAAARAVLHLDDASQSSLDAFLCNLTSDLHQDFEMAPVRLPDGRSIRVMAMPRSAGRTDLLVLPDRALPSIDLAPGAESAHVFDDIPVALVALDPEGRVVTTNRLARALLGLGDGEPRHFWEVVEGLGRPVSDWLDDARAGRALGRPEVLRATLTPEETFVQIILRRATGGGGDGALVAVISDATELKSLEARFVQSQKMQAIGQLAGGVAHDFNNLLTAISGHCDLLLISRDRYDPDYNDLLQIHQNANRAAALVRQLLAFSRKQTLKPETFRLESLLEDLTHLLTRLVGERIVLDLAHDPDLAPIRADRRQLEQVIMNLVVNARDAMPMGGTIRIQTEALHLETELEHGRARVPPGDYAAIRVIDEGVGIPPTIIDKVFEPFFTTKRMGEGTGLGLSTAYGIVKQMGGYIFADSVEGSGSTFTLYFASQADTTLLTRSAASAKAGHASAPQVSHQVPVPVPAKGSALRARDNARLPDRTRAGPRALGDERRQGDDSATPALAGIGPGGAHVEANGAILLVEDEAPVRAFAARALRLQGYRVFEAQDGEQALEFLADRSLQIDLFVSDVIMPGIDGPGWVSEALTARPGTPVVFMSGYTEDTLSAALRRIPQAVFLGKPFSLKDLSETIAKQLEMDSAG